MPVTKYYTAAEISSQFDNLSCKEQVRVLYGALCKMQEYNGRSRIMCIAFAMGYQNDEGDEKSYFKKSEQ